MGPEGDRVAAAFAAVPRAGFLPEARRADAAHDGPIPIGHDQTNSQPRTVEAMLRLLRVAPGHRVLDVGAGSGWTTALLAHLCSPDGQVTGTEVRPALVGLGVAHLAGLRVSGAEILPAPPDRLGWPQRAPYDRILVSADAPVVPDELVAQLAVGGRLVLPVRGRMTLVVAAPEGVRTSTHGVYRFVPLVMPAAPDRPTSER